MHWRKLWVSCGLIPCGLGLTTVSWGEESTYRKQIETWR